MRKLAGPLLAIVETPMVREHSPERVLPALVREDSARVSGVQPAGWIDEVDRVSANVRLARPIRELHGEHGVAHPGFSRLVELIGQRRREAVRTLTERSHSLERHPQLTRIVLGPDTPVAEVRLVLDDVDAINLAAIVDGHRARPILQVAIAARRHDVKLPPQMIR